MGDVMAITTEKVVFPPPDLTKKRDLSANIEYAKLFISKGENHVANVLLNKVQRKN